MNENIQRITDEIQSLSLAIADAKERQEALVSNLPLAPLFIKDGVVIQPSIYNIQPNLEALQNAIDADGKKLVARLADLFYALNITREYGALTMAYDILQRSSHDEV